MICLEGTEKRAEGADVWICSSQTGWDSICFDCLVLRPDPKATTLQHRSPASSPHPSAMGCKEGQVTANKAEMGTNYWEINSPTLPMV